MNITAVQMDTGEWLLDCDEHGILGFSSNPQATAADHAQEEHHDPLTYHQT